MYDKNILVFLFISIFFCSNVVFSEGVPSYREIRDSYHPSDGTILDLHGRFLQTIRFNVRERKLAWTEEGEIPETLLLALFVQEDKRFFEHSGVDLLAILGAMKDRILGNSKRGASTLSMQLAGIFLGTKPGRRNIFDKWEQMRFATKNRTDLEQERNSHRLSQSDSVSWGAQGAQSSEPRAFSKGAFRIE